MDIIFQLSGSILLCYYVLKRSTVDYMKQSYTVMSNAKFNDKKTCSFVLETYLTRVGIFYIAIGYLLTIFKVPNYVIAVAGEDNSAYYIANLSLVALLTFLSFVLIKVATKLRVKLLREKFDFKKYTESGESYIYSSENDQE